MNWILVKDFRLQGDRKLLKVGINMKKALPILLIVIGIGLILTPTILEEVVAYHSKSIVEEEVTYEVIKINNQNHELEAEYDFSAIKDVDIKSIIKGSQNFNKEFGLGNYPFLIIFSILG